MVTHFYLKICGLKKIVARVICFRMYGFGDVALAAQYKKCMILRVWVACLVHDATVSNAVVIVGVTDSGQYHSKIILCRS